MNNSQVLVVRFHADKDLSLVFEAVESDGGVFTGLRLVKVRGTSSDANLRPELMDVIFAPQIVRVAESRWTMTIRPLTQQITIDKRPSGKYMCFYPFAEKHAHIKEVWVDGSVMKKTLWFTIHATFQASKTSPKEELRARIDCSDSFVKQLMDVLG